MIWKMRLRRDWGRLDMIYKWGELIALEYGKPVKDKARTDGQYPVYGTNGQIGTSNLTPLCDHPSFILGRKGAYRGVHYSSVPFSVIDTAFYAVNLHPDILDIKWAYYRFLTYDINSMDSGSAIPSTDRYEIYAIEVDLPAIDEQKREVKLLECFDDKIANITEINDNLQQQAATLYGKYFPYTVTDDLPAGWCVGTVGEIVEIHDSKRIPLSGAQRAKMEKRIYPYYGAASLMDYVDEYIFDGKYLLLGEDGTVVDDAGYPILQYVWGQFWVNNHAHILTGKLGFNVESLLLLFKRTPVKSIVTGAVQPKISQANLRSIQVVVPPQPELDAFNELIRPLFDQIRQNQDQNKALASLRDALLPKLMSGEVDVSSIQL